MNIIIGTLENYSRNLSLKIKWQQKKATSNWESSDEPKTEKQRLQEQVWKNHENSDDTLKSITLKLESGKELSPEEMKYLQAKDPALYQKALEASIERKGYENNLKNCKTKEDADRLKLSYLSKSLNRVQSVVNNPVIPLSKKLEICMQENVKAKNIEQITLAYIKSGAYQALESEAEQIQKQQEHNDISLPQIHDIHEEASFSEQKSEYLDNTTDNQRNETPFIFFREHTSFELHAYHNYESTLKTLTDKRELFIKDTNHSFSQKV